MVSKITPDDEMPVTADGKRVDCILNALGVCNRLNPAQLYEVEINFISDNIVKDMKSRSLNDAKNLLFEYVKDVNKTQYKSMVKFYNNLEKKQKVQFIKDIMNEGISIHQPPFWNNVNLKKLKFLYDKYGYEPYDVYIKGDKCENKLIISDMYMIRLKHEPSGKLSIRSTSYINMKNSPSKSLSFKKHEDPYSKTPIRIGEFRLFKKFLIA